jgi:Asp-tRNA(Asn)/Glu-tRNA(Gln) amidotransferase B subunit
MAKKGTTKKTTKTVETVETLDVPVVAMEDKLQTEIIDNVTNEISEISAKMENIQPTEEIVEAIMTAKSEDAQEIIAKEVEKIENLEREIQSKIDDIVNKNPEVVKTMKKVVPRFTNFWNGMEF